MKAVHWVTHRNINANKYNLTKIKKHTNILHLQKPLTAAVPALSVSSFETELLFWLLLLPELGLNIGAGPLFLADVCCP